MVSPMVTHKTNKFPMMSFHLLYFLYPMNFLKIDDKKKLLEEVALGEVVVAVSCLGVMVVTVRFSAFYLFLNVVFKFLLNF